MGALSSPLLPLLVALLSRPVNALSQQYCSSQNTGAGFSPVFNTWQSNGACFDTCKSTYAFAVVQNQLCWCSNYIPSQQQSISSCGKICPGYGDEHCGDIDAGLFGYIALSIAPSGTAGSSSSPTSSQTSTQATRTTTTAPPSSPPSSTTQSPPPATTSSIEASPSPTTSTTNPLVPSSTAPIPSKLSQSIVSTPSTTISSSSSESVTEIPTPIVGTQIVTLAGSVVTQTVTSTPRPQVTSGSAVDQVQATSSTPVGAIVGGVIGGLALIAAIVLAIFFIRRRTRRDDSQSGLNRNASVLSRAGLISSPRPGDAEKAGDDTVYGSQRHSALYNDQYSPTIPPAAAHDHPGMPQRRNSRPLVYDQRMNPAALMENWEANGSRSSINTMQDQRDYSRPLGITNPDTHHDD